MTWWDGWLGLAVAATGAAVLLVAAPAAAAPRRVRRLGAAELGRRPPARTGRRAQVVPRAVATAALVRRRIGRPPDESLDRRLAGSVVVGVTVGLWHPVVGVIAGGVAWVACRGRERMTERCRERELVEEVPDLVELFRLAVAAGLTVHLAVDAVASRADGIAGRALARVPARVAMGERLADALDGFARWGEPVRPLAAALAAAERYGDPLASVLERLSVEARTLRRRQAEEAARRLPVQLLFPLVLCVLPAFLLLAVGPLVLAAVPQLPH